ncbi:TPA: hypothetical protein QDA89_000986 [Burkholderia vietnamiensis]|uniref:hypothetical protein n=1 Tax=Burkholderia vietnamiensis TaxID=60552 RepID=UPI0026519B1B|nr:hypothetical protein [Burkholderia vietnamiensis]MDN8075308.1 hypothetical protein [Burkholderia vietnamiensis]HDR8982115.1 hypothetical protein [Burkholderia vietnamiensis]
MRIKWLPLTVGISEAQLVRRLRDMPFTRSDEPLTRGFRIERASKGQVTGQYIEQEVTDRAVSLPDGTEIQQELVEVTVTNFRIDMERPLGLEVRNPPRSLMPFIGAIGSASDFAVTVDSRMKVDLRQAVKEFRRLVGVPSAVCALECSGIELERGVVASLGMSGTDDVLSSFDNLPFSSQRSSIDSLRVDFVLDGGKCSVEVTKAGAAKIRGAAAEFVAGCVHGSFERALLR